MGRPLIKESSAREGADSIEDPLEELQDDGIMNNSHDVILIAPTSDEDGEVPGQPVLCDMEEPTKMGFSFALEKENVSSQEAEKEE